MKLTKHFLKFEKGDSVLLLNGATVKPVLIEKGKEFILNFLKDADTIRDKNKIIKKYKDGKLIDFLFEHNILVGDEDKEDYSVRKNNGECSNKTSGLSLYLLLSQSCNLGCVYCLNGEKTYNVSKKLMMTEEVAYKGIDKLTKTLMAEGNFEIVFFGGEPLINWDLAKRIIIYCEEKVKKELPKLNIKYHLTSNLTLFPDDLIEWAKKYKITFLCDVDGPGKLHDTTRPYKKGKGSYDTIVKNIEKLRKAGLEVALRATVTSKNEKHIKEISKHHKNLGGAASAFVCVNAVTSDMDILDKSLLPDPDVVAKGLKELVQSDIWDKQRIFPLNEFLTRMKPDNRNIWACGAPFGNTPVLDVNGDIYACIYLVGIQKYKTGNVFSEDAYPDKKVVKQMMDVINIDNSKECRECNFRYLCGGGCPVGRLTIQGNPKADKDVIQYTQDVACKVNKGMIEEALWLYAKKAEEEKEKQLSQGSLEQVSVCL